MLRARQLAAQAFVLGLGLGAVSTAPAQTTGGAWQATPASILKSSLRGVVSAQDKYRATHPFFASTLEALQLSPGVDVKIQILGASPGGWRAKATHRARPGRSCVVFVGVLAGPELPKTDGDGEMAGEERVPLCDRME
jgi:hypothetical protein